MVKADVVILTALEVEYTAVRNQLKEPTVIVHPAGTIYEVGQYEWGDRTWQVAIVQIGMGNPGAASECERAVSHFSPSYAFFLGVAGGIKDVAIGDIVVATKVYYYEAGKADKEYKPRFDFGESSYSLIQLARLVARDSAWTKRIKGGNGSQSADRTPKAWVGVLASGENVVSSTLSSVYQLIKTYMSDALAIEMEGYGFFRAIKANEGVKSLEIRSISDLLEGKEHADAAGWQDKASGHAAAFAMEVLSRLMELGRKPFGNWDALFSVAAQLYPRGPEDREIWARAEGSVATLDLSGSGKTAWYKALRDLRNGGGGLIRVESLLRTMQEDFPSNEDLIRLGSKV